MSHVTTKHTEKSTKTEPTATSPGSEAGPGAARRVVNGVDLDRLKALVARVASDPREGIAEFRASTRWQGGLRSNTTIDGWSLGGARLRKSFRIGIDEPEELCGSNAAPNPQEFLLAAVNACIMATWVAGCAMHGIELESLEIRSRGELDLRGFLGLDPDVNPGYDELEYTVSIKGNGTRKQYEKIAEAVAATSPNFHNLARAVRLKPRLDVR